MGWRDVPKVPTSLTLHPAVLERVRPGMRVLDVGCGEAGAGEEVRAAGADYFGLDLNLPSLKRAVLRFSVVQGDCLALPFGDGIFDVVILRAVLTVLPEDGRRLACMAEALGVSRSGGVVAVQDFMMTPEQPLYQERYQRGADLGLPQGAFPVEEGGSLLYTARHATEPELRELVRRAGGEVISLAVHPSPTRSGKIINGVTLLAHPKQDLSRPRA
ncbi:class I SAM-dependent methyltransferase [Fundidesulfovibrio agrisoli]|uniref:class I SAM-dependent methyltransferase n=1 Tax=Fundidesulfovibrio agrisoli TaxID=2922717 RepID=UPI001FAE3390|nr:class I SAM-dependent methyltransferase [Fundidesulfovibrio agrisoli]